MYVISEDSSGESSGGKNNNGGNEGFIPHSYCAQFGSQLAELALNVKKKLPRVPAGGGSGAEPSSRDEAGADGLDAVGLPRHVSAAAATTAPSITTTTTSTPGQAELPMNSRSNSIMSSETSSQPDIHPFYKVLCIMRYEL